MGARVGGQAVRGYALPALLLASNAALIVGLLELLLDTGAVSSTFLLPPSAVIAAIPQAFVSSAVALGWTLAEIIMSFLLALGIGMAVGLSVGRIPHAYRASNDFLSALYSVPKITILPAMIIWFGLGTQSVLTFATLEAAVPIAIMISGGARGVDDSLVRVARSSGANSVQVQTKIVLPSLRHILVNCVQVGLTFSAVGVVISQMFLGTGGVGILLLNDALTLNLAHLYALSLVLALSVGGILAIGTVSVRSAFSPGLAS